METVEKNVYEAYENIAELYDKELWNDMPYNNQIDEFLRMLKENKVLDVGCAMGSFTKYVADKGYKIDGIDFSPKMIEIANKKVKNADFYVMNMLDITLSEKYNGIMAINSLIHIEKSKMIKVIEEFKKVLEADGIIFIILQEGDGEKYIKEPLNADILEFVNFYQIDEIMRLFEKCNLEIIKMEKIRDDAEFELGNNQLAFYLRKK